MKTGDLEPKWIIDVSDDGVQADLNGVSSWRFVGWLNGVVVFTDNSPADTVDPIVTYRAALSHTWVAGETDDPGTMRGEVIAVWPGGREQTFPGRGQAVIEIEPSLG